MTPKIGIVGRAMASVRPLFPSRFPASDYKAIVAVALIVLSADAWSRLSQGARTRSWRVALVGCLLVAGALFAPKTHALPTRALWLVLLVIAASMALALVRTPARVLVCLLVALVVVDGVREINDYRLLGTNSPWQVPPSALAFDIHRDGYVRELPKLLAATPRSRPARVPAAATAEPNASGWVADAYHFADYDPTLERSLWQAEQSPAWTALLLDPWHGYTFSCATVGCSGPVHLPNPTRWRPSSAVQTVSYGTSRIVYSVNTTKPVLMVENELAIRGWHANTSRVRLVDAGIPLRAWRLSPGHYRFVASFQEPDRNLQYLILAVAIAAWAGCVFALRRRRSPSGTDGPPRMTLA